MEWCRQWHRVAADSCTCPCLVQCSATSHRERHLWYYSNAPPPLHTHTNKKAQLTQGLRATAHHSKMAVSRHLGFHRTANSAIWSANTENHNLERNMEWVGCTVCETFAFKLYCDLEIGVQGHSKSSKVTLFDTAHTTLYSSSIVTMPLSITVSEI